MKAFDMQIDSKGFYLNTNEDSWNWVAQEIEEYPDTEYWADYKNFARPVLRDVIDSGLHHHFRAGFSMSHIIVSTADRRLELYEPKLPHVSLRFEKEKQVAWSHANLHFHQAESFEPVNTENVFAILKSFLADLWRETRPNEEAPAALGPDIRS
jgi:hypothetical protein